MVATGRQCSGLGGARAEALGCTGDGAMAARMQALLRSAWHQSGHEALLHNGRATAALLLKRALRLVPSPLALLGV